MKLLRIFAILVTFLFLSITTLPAVYAGVEADPRAETVSLKKSVKKAKKTKKTKKSKKAKKAKKSKEAKKAAAHQILIQNFAFEPATLTVKKGDTVEFIQKDSTPHTVSTDPHPEHTQLPGFDSELLSLDQKYTYTFDKVGTWTYHCSPHPFMTGTIIVTE